MKKSRKFVSGIILTIFLGALGSALWDSIKPFSVNLTEWIFNIATLGLKNIQNLIYLNVARGFHESASLESLNLIIAFFFGMPVVLSIFLLSANKSKPFIEKLAKKLATGERNNGMKYFRFFLFFYILFITTFSGFIFLRISYTNKFITDYQQRLAIIRPYIESQDYLLIQSRFAQIKKEEDYIKIMQELTTIAEENDLNIN